MLRAAVLGSLGAAVGLFLPWPGAGVLLDMPWLVFVVFSGVFLVAGPLMGLLSLPLGWTQTVVRRRMSPRWYAPAAILLGAPFGIALCFLILRFFGKQGNPWTDLDWLPWMPAALGAGLGLGWGRLRDSAGNE